MSVCLGTGNKSPVCYQLSRGFSSKTSVMDKIRRKVSLLQASEDRVLISQEELEADGLHGIVLRDYQLEGVIWVAQCCRAKHGCILGDEMGLGKTIQARCFVLIKRCTDFKG